MKTMTTETLDKLKACWNADGIDGDKINRILTAEVDLNVISEEELIALCDALPATEAITSVKVWMYLRQDKNHPVRNKHGKHAVVGAEIYFSFEAFCKRHPELVIRLRKEIDFVKSKEYSDAELKKLLAAPKK
jgi:hypothetical protein